MPITGLKTEEERNCHTLLVYIYLFSSYIHFFSEYPHAIYMITKYLFSVSKYLIKHIIKYTHAHTDLGLDIKITLSRGKYLNWNILLSCGSHAGFFFLQAHGKQGICEVKMHVRYPPTPTPAGSVLPVEKSARKWENIRECQEKCLPVQVPWPWEWSLRRPPSLGHQNHRANVKGDLVCTVGSEDGGPGTLASLAELLASPHRGKHTDSDTASPISPTEQFRMLL